MDMISQNPEVLKTFMTLQSKGIDINEFLTNMIKTQAKSHGLSHTALTEKQSNYYLGKAGIAERHRQGLIALHTESMNTLYSFINPISDSSKPLSKDSSYKMWKKIAIDSPKLMLAQMSPVEILFAKVASYEDLRRDFMGVSSDGGFYGQDGLIPRMMRAQMESLQVLEEVMQRFGTTYADYAMPKVLGINKIGNIYQAAAKLLYARYFSSFRSIPISEIQEMINPELALNDPKNKHTLAIRNLVREKVQIGGRYPSEFELMNDDAGENAVILQLQRILVPNLCSQVPTKEPPCLPVLAPFTARSFSMGGDLDPTGVYYTILENGVPKWKKVAEVGLKEWTSTGAPDVEVIIKRLSGGDLTLVRDVDGAVEDVSQLRKKVKELESKLGKKK